MDEDSTPGEERRYFSEFDCPECSANNPMDDGFYSGEEVVCFYCGESFHAMVKEGKLKLIS